MFTRNKNRVVYIADSSAKDISEDLGYLECTVERPARLIGSPIETGEMRYDHKVVDPRQITITCIVDTGNVKKTEKKIREMLADKSTNFYVVSAKSGLYHDLALVNASEPETVEMLDAVKYTLKFQEVLVQSQAKQTKNADSQGTKKGSAKAQ